jgi:engulfment/cell motility protein 1
MSDTSLSSSTAEKLVNRMSTGASISHPISSTSTPEDDKVLKMATFSLQKYLKVRTFLFL